MVVRDSAIWCMMGGDGITSYERRDCSVGDVTGGNGIATYTTVEVRRCGYKKAAHGV